MSYRVWDYLFAWLGELLSAHPISFILAVPTAGFVTYRMARYIANDVNQRNKKLGYKVPDVPQNFQGVLIMSAILFCGLMFGFYSLLNYLGSFLTTNPGF